jgi:elongation factor G
VALVGHSHHGKTALMEWMLFDEHVLTKEPSKAQSQLDSDPAEAARSHSIFSHYSKLLHNKHLLALADTPWGDFPADAQASVDGADAAVLVVSAADSVQSGTISAYSHCQNHQIPTLIALTKLDRPFLQMETVLNDIQAILGDGVVSLPLQVHKGDLEVVPLFVLDPDTKQFTRNPAFHSDTELQAAWTSMEEAVAMTDDDLLVEFLEEGVLAVDDVIKAMKKAVVHHKAVPLVYTSAESNVGVQELMDVIVGVFPSPIDVRDHSNGL